MFQLFCQNTKWHKKIQITGIYGYIYHSLTIKQMFYIYAEKQDLFFHFIYYSLINNHKWLDSICTSHSKSKLRYNLFVIDHSS